MTRAFIFDNNIFISFSFLTSIHFICYIIVLCSGFDPGLLYVHRTPLSNRSQGQTFLLVEEAPLKLFLKNSNKLFFSFYLDN